MAKQRSLTSDDLGIFQGGTTPFERAGQLALSRTPAAFNFSDLETNYPTREVRPLMPAYIQEQIDEENLQRKAQEVALKTAQARLNIYDAELNQQNAIAEQIPMARQRFAQLDPASENYPQMRDQILIEFPQVEYDPAFMRSVVGRLDSTHGNFMKKAQSIPQDAISVNDYRSAMNEVMKVGQFAAGRDFTPEEQDYLTEMQFIVDRYKAQSGRAATEQPPLSPEIPQDSVEEDSETQAIQPQSGFTEGKIYKQDGVRYRYTNGQFVPVQ